MLDSTVRLTLRHLDLGSLAAERLLIGTELAEGPGIGLTPVRIRDTWYRVGDCDGLIAKARRLATALYAVDPDGEPARNPAFAYALARLQYPLDPRTLPPADDAAALHEHYRAWYNDRPALHHFERAVEEVR